MRLFDTHVHLTDERYDEDRGLLMAALKQNGLDKAVTIACEPNEIMGVIGLVSAYEDIYAAVGIHPHYASGMTEDAVKAIIDASGHEKVVAIGEIGLDYHYDLSPRDVQRECFSLLLKLAKKLDLPAILHVREAFGDAMDILRENKNQLPNFVMHCYSGSKELAKELLDMGAYISFAGPITFKNAGKLPEICGYVPLERILIETDCPYLSPEPMRGKRNEPAFVKYIAEKVAKIKQLSLEEIAQTTHDNACYFFGI